MSRVTRSASWLCACVAGGLYFVAPALAQFDEADTVPPISLGAFVNLNLRGERGKSAETSVSFGNGPSFGGRVDYQVARTLAIGAVGSVARANEKQQRGGTAGFSSEDFWLIGFSGELLLKVKANVPGYFVIGGGVRRVVPDSEDPNTQFTRVDSFTEPFGLVGAGLEFASTRRRAFRFDLRLFLISPAEEPREDFVTNSLELDFAAGLSFLYRP